MTATALIVARMGSSRLPGKSMMPILGEPLVARLIERVERANSVEQIVLSTTTRPEDDELQGLAEQLGVACYRGSSEDVLGRIHGAAQQYAGDPVLEILGDNPLVHSALIDDVVDFFQRGEFDYAVNVTEEFPYAEPGLAKFPIGVRVEVVSASALERCHRLATEDEFREHSTAFIYTNPALFKIGYFPAAGSWKGLSKPELTFAVNHLENFQLISQMFERCYPDDADFSLSKALRAFEADPMLRPLMGAPARNVEET